MQTRKCTSTLWSFLLGTSFLLNSMSTYGIGDEANKVEVGYSSSYLPTQKGPLVNNKTSQEEHSILNLDTTKMSIADKFDKSRKGTLGADFDLKQFFYDIGYQPTAEHWEGKCHQWAAGANDKNIKPLINQTKGILCQGLDGKGIVLEDVDLKELITATYPSVTQKLPGPGNGVAFFGGRTNNNQAQEKDINELDYELMDSLGIDDFSPNEFHNKIHHYLKSGQGVVLDVDPLPEVWNQPVHSAESKVEKVSELPLLPTQFYEVTTSAAQEKINGVEEVNQVFLALLEKQDKTKSDKVSAIVENDPNAGLVVSPTLIKQIKEMESEGGDLSTVIDNLMRFRKTTFQEAKDAGLALNSKYQLKKVSTDVEYLLETSFAQPGTPKHLKTYQYYTLETKGSTGDDVVYSQWIGSRGSKGRPDFLWVPSCESDTCHSKADTYKDYFKKLPASDRVNMENLGLTIGLSDLLKLFKECFPLDKAMEVAEGFMENIKGIESLWELSPKKKKEISDQYKIIKDSKLPIKLSNLNKLMKIPGLSIDAGNNLSMIDWDQQTSDCIEHKNGVNTKVDFRKCMSDPVEGEFLKWGLFDKECWEASGSWPFRKWLRRVPTSLCN